MDYTVTTLQEPLKIVGISYRVTHPGSASYHIGMLWERFFQVESSILLAVSKKSYCVYTDYTPDGHYTVIIGKEVSNFGSIPTGMFSCIIVPGSYAHYRIEGPMPQTLTNFWSLIWTSQLDYMRALGTDFEIHMPGSDQIDVFISMQEC